MPDEQPEPKTPEIMKNVSKLTQSILLMAGLAGAGTASAAMIATESFDYSEDPLSGANGGTGWGGAWGNASANGSKNVVAGSLSSSLGETVSGNQVNMVGVSAGSAEIFRDLAVDWSVNATYYVGFTFRKNSAVLRTTALSLFDGSNEELLIGPTSASNNFHLGKATLVDSGVEATTNDIFRLVAKIEVNSGGVDQFSLFVNQATEGTADASGSEEIGTIDRIRLFAGGGG
ncbi:MAG: hypothetical protein ACQKBY_07205, partial [Verrucomicrobiales bacterium]